MKILIAVASKHGNTREIADVIAEELRAAGHLASVRDIDEVGDLAAYDAAVVGSAVYLGNWLPEARRFVEDARAQLSAIPVWLFSSGPIVFRGGPVGQPMPEDDPAHLDVLLDATQARGHHVFGGKLDRHQLNFVERLGVRAAKASEGDFRDWEEIRGWARGIAAALQGSVESAAGR